MKRARYLAAPTVFVAHNAQRSFIGPGSIALPNGDLLMVAPWGRPPTDFAQLAAQFPVPPEYRSRDGGRTWQSHRRLAMPWALPGMISDGGFSFLRLHDGRLALAAHRHVSGLHGGGLPVFALSSDDGEQWTAARLIGEPEGVWYVMNDRLIQLATGRLVLPVSHMPQGLGTYEGDRNLGLCFFSDDLGVTWQRSRVPARLDDTRGMAEPAVAEVAQGRLLMLARTGSGSHHAAWSSDGGDTWSAPVPTSLRAACSPLTLRTLPDRRLIVFYNPAEPLRPGAFFPRTPLAYAVSADGGQSWGEPVLVDEAGSALLDRQNIYPTVSFTPEGMAVVYSTHVADPKGSFGGSHAHHWPDCGGKCALLAYPD